MGLFDFLSDKGEAKPAESAPKPVATEKNADFFGTGETKSESNTYTVVSGDTLSKIAKHHYGDGAKWHQIYEANKAIIGNNPDRIEIGQVLTIPSL